MGVVVWSADYKPFGQADVTVNTAENNFRLPGQYYDQETGLHYNYHRTYSPGVGRYLSPDPVSSTALQNLYGYAEDNPVGLIDPLGLWTLAIDFSGTVGAGAGATGGHTYIFDSELNIARIEHFGGGGIGGATGSVAAQAQWTNAPTIYALEGLGVSTGFSIGSGASVTGEWIVMSNGWQGFNAGVSGGPSTPIELHSFVEMSQIAWQMNLVDAAVDWFGRKFPSLAEQFGLKTADPYKK